ncbi:MAG: hypothetical protein ABIF82_14025 [Planctomycetota bacterium]
MDMLEFACPNCGKTLRLPKRLAGKQAKCHACGEVVDLASVTAEREPPAAPKSGHARPRTLRKNTRRSSGLGRCKTCRKPVAKSAKTCPHCGAKGPIEEQAQKAAAIGCAVILLGAIALAVGPCSSVFRTDPKVKAHEEKYGNKLEAFVAAQQFVEKRLLSPGSASFGWQGSEECVTDLGDGRYEVKGWVDSDNAFGAKIRNNFRCVVRHDNGTWRLEVIVLRDRLGNVILE